MKTSDSTPEEFTDEYTHPNSLPPGDDVSILKKDFQEETFRIISNPLFKFDDNFKSSNVNPLLSYLEKDSIPPGIDLIPPPIFEVSSSNPTSPTLTEKKEKLKENISSGALLVFKEPSFLLPPPEPPDESLKNAVLNFYQSRQAILHVPLNSSRVPRFSWLLLWTQSLESPNIRKSYSVVGRIIMDPSKIEAINQMAETYYGERRMSFAELKLDLVSAPILTLPIRFWWFSDIHDASKKGLVCALMQHGNVIDLQLQDSQNPL
ncbi:hypothetical protein Tco_0390759 [Tanacetum coccineum]